MPTILLVVSFSYFQKRVAFQPFSAWRPQKGHIYLDKPAALNLQLQVYLRKYGLLVDTKH